MVVIVFVIVVVVVISLKRQYFRIIESMMENTTNEYECSRWIVCVCVGMEDLGNCLALFVPMKFPVFMNGLLCFMIVAL